MFPKGHNAQPRAGLETAPENTHYGATLSPNATDAFAAILGEEYTPNETSRAAGPITYQRCPHTAHTLPNHRLSRAALRKNAVLHVLDGVFFFAGIALFSREVFMPAMVRDLSDSDVLIGLIAFVYWVGYVAPLTFFARRAEAMPRQKRAVVLCAVAQRVGWLVLLLGLPLLWKEPHLLLALFFAALGAASLGSGMIVPIWTDWFARTSPQSAWGRILGLRLALFGLVVLGIGPASQWVMDRFANPRRYQVLLAGSLLCYALSTVCLTLITEPEAKPDQQGGGNWGAFIRALAGRVLRHRAFLRFLVAVLLVSVPLVVMATYLTKYGLGLPGVSYAMTGTFTTAFYVAMSAGSLVAGRFGDRSHPIAPYRVLPAAVIAASLCAMAAVDGVGILLAFGFLGLAMGIQVTAGFPAVWTYAGPARRPSYTAAYSTVQGCGFALAPVAAGVVLEAGWVSYPLVFLACGVLALTGWVLLLFTPRAEPAGP